MNDKCKFTDSKHDVEGAKRLIALGFPALHEYYEDLFSEVCDIEGLNSPVARIIHPFLTQNGVEVWPEARRRLRSLIKQRQFDDADCVLGLIDNWDASIVANFVDDLVALVTMGGANKMYMASETNEFESVEGTALFLLLRKTNFELPEKVWKELPNIFARQKAWIVDEYFRLDAKIRAKAEAKCSWLRSLTSSA